MFIPTTSKHCVRHSVATCQWFYNAYVSCVCSSTDDYTSTIMLIIVRTNKALEYFEVCQSSEKIQGSKKVEIILGNVWCNLHDVFLDNIGNVSLFSLIVLFPSSVESVDTINRTDSEFVIGFYSPTIHVCNNAIST